ncbi:GNAT superfamily N-acetyltransferase [Microbacterium resistens]|uniref:GNAT superfamily N-acetyltransferase n=1 Tax=Microbacterium resistens TaxID=156977 RepID=A0ABU1SFA0_9MICO|nr:GNAT family N-acetyltransferase [Microbacterium resistens]MDR6868287.1 GNAT superfamily N-acetyltransferase [Microbacterium resistens]
MTDAPLLVRPIVRADWPWIQEWFADPALDRELGPLDQEWLDHVLDHPEGVELVVKDAHGPVGLVGVVWGTGPLPHVITDLAVSPALRGRGLGRLIVQAVRRWDGHPDHREWQAFVDTGNDAAQLFFTRIGWTHLGVEDAMHVYRVLAPAPSAAS